MITGIDHIVLTVTDIERSISFYQSVLGLEAITFAGGRRAVRCGQQKINLQLLGHEERNQARIGSGDVCLLTHWSIEEVMAHLTKMEVTIIEGPVWKSGAVGPILSVYFNDPDGNLIEVSRYQRKEKADVKKT
ncbi:MAG TPA: VOC family protein [Anaerolineae bacterium]|nr:VOC family protein [Anaerolineae bacterium]